GPATRPQRPSGSFTSWVSRRAEERQLQRPFSARRAARNVGEARAFWPFKIRRLVAQSHGAYEGARTCRDQELITCRRRCQPGRMDVRENDRLTDAELHAFFDRLFPQDFAGSDVLAEIAPVGWEQSPLLACFHPSGEQAYEEAVQFHRNLESLRSLRRRPDGSAHATHVVRPEPTLEEIRSEYR